MPSTFTWLDYSEHERQQMLDVIELFGEKTTRDELGLGSVRDAFADLMFPGTSTVQTVAKYFLFVPWIYLDLEGKKTPSAKVADRARKLEIRLAQELEESGETEGVIGRRAKEKLQRLPSSIYWQGLLEWRIRQFDGSRDEYHRSLNLFYARQQSHRSTSDGFAGESASEPDLQNWHDVPRPNDDFPKGATLSLSPAEATYLQERMITSCGDSLMAYLVRERIDVESVPFVWDLRAELPDRLSNQVKHGQNFSESMHGAQLLYNLILAEQSANSELTNEYRRRLSKWWEIISSRGEELDTWDRHEFWRIVRLKNPRIHPRAKRFIENWIELVLSAADITYMIDGTLPRQLVEDREVWLKRGLARVRSQRARDLWNGAAGSSQLDLRWRSARQILSDILQGLEAFDHA